ncbi:MAG: T9SS type A sorting domain-containing protein [Paludibacteraceae bacterium]|nr:T9SS type A sorting domain-containing protein [Paludibacteraceae bacterium]
MNRLNNFFLVLLILIGAASLHAQTPVAVYTSTNSQYYRIPAIVTASNGDLLLFNDDRHTSNSDVGSNTSSNGIDLLVKRLSWDGTAYGSVGNSLNITPNKSQATWCYGDPAVVADRESNEVLVLAIGGLNGWTSNTTSYSIRSHNNGQTWDAPVQLNFGTSSFPRPTDHNVNGFFFASGRILQSKMIKVGSYYRLYVAFLYTTNGTGDNTAKFNQVYYSDDFGSTWNLLGTAAQSYADEAKLEELPNGNLIISTRAAGGRYFNTFTYSDVQNGMGSWGTHRQFYCFTTNTSSTCTINGDMLTMTAYRTIDNKQVTLLLQSTITGRSSSSDAADSRKNVKIFYHEIDTNTTGAILTSGWTATSFILPNTSTFGGYSAMTMQADDKIGVYYEGNTTTNGVNDYSNLYYIAYTLEELTGNAYTLTDPNPPVVVVPDVEVPDDEVPVYEWHGTNSPYWNDPLNWTVVNAVNNAPLSRATVPTLPATNSNVKILKPSAGEYNPVLTTATSVANLYVAPGAALGGQHYLTITGTGRVFTDVEIPSNQWVRVCMPLSNTYSGDMFTAIQGGKILNGTTVLTPDDEDDEDYYFTGATYDPVDGGGDNAHNRKFPYSIYQRVFADAVNVMNDDIPDETHQLNSEWSVPYNDLAARFQDAQGFDLWSPSTESISMFRFPSVTDYYQYYTNNGTPHTTRSETVNHTMSGTMAYGASNNGVKDVTITRNKRSEGEGNPVPMYAVGNPSFAYMDIAEFIRVNAYGASHSGNASVVGNITPYVYKYNEDNPGSTGEAGETIYYLDNDKDLYTVSPSFSDDNTIPTGGTTTQVAANSTEKYIAPTRGFRVMAGQAEVSAVEPKLIGNYSTSEFQIAPLKIVTRNNYSETALNNASPNTYLHISSVANNEEGKYSSTLAISPGNTPDEVVIMGVCGFGMVRGKVDPINQTITIPAGSPCSYITLNSTWQALSNNSGTADLEMYAWDGTVANCTTKINGKYTQYAANLDNSTPVVLDYTIASDNTVSISSRTGFVLYPCRENKGDVLGSCPLYHMNLNNTATPYNYGTFPAALNAYNYMNASTVRETSTDAYIYPEIFGTYRYMVQSVVSVNSAPNVSKSVKSFEILPIEGSYNTVRISGLYEGSEASETNDILGYITTNSLGYQLTIPGGQVIANGSSSFPDFFVLYSATGRNNNMNFTINNTSGSVYLYIDTYKAEGSLQISRYDSNPSSAYSSPGYYANGFIDLTTTSTANYGHYMVRTAQYTPGSSGNTGNPTFSVGTNYETINLKYTPAMFNANPGYTPSASSAPRKTAAQGSAMASVTLKEGNRTANTLVTRRDNANNGYNAFEDASLIDMADNAKSIATLAGNQMVAVNTLGDTTAVQLVINNVSGNFTLDVDNISALGSNARLYDAVNATEQPIDGNHQTLTLNMSVNDSPLRYSIRWDVATGTEDIELPNGNSDVWFQAFGGNGTIRVNSNNVMSQVRLFDAAGKEIARRSNQGYETSFNALQPGVYMVEATDGQTTKTIKVSVK